MSNIAEDAREQANMTRMNREWVEKHPLTALPNCDRLVQSILNNGVNNFLGHGAFSRVYAIDRDRVLKFSYDLVSLQIMKKLCTRSNYFPRVDQLLENQASDGEMVYHVAIVERLQTGYPSWIKSVVDGYCGPFRADSPNMAKIRLIAVSHSIASGHIVVPTEDVAPLSAAMRILAEECLSWRCLADLRTEINFMTRNNKQVVIADPAHPAHLI